MNTPRRMVTPARRVRGLGAGHSGTSMFWHQRITSLASIPLTIAVIVIAIALLRSNHAGTVQILGSPLIAVIMLLFIITLFYHMWIGMQEIIVDYVHDEGLKYFALLGNTFYVFALTFACCFAILKLSFGV